MSGLGDRGGRGWVGQRERVGFGSGGLLLVLWLLFLLLISELA